MNKKEAAKNSRLLFCFGEYGLKIRTLQDYG